MVVESLLVVAGGAGWKISQVEAAFRFEILSIAALFSSCFVLFVCFSHEVDKLLGKLVLISLRSVYTTGCLKHKLLCC